ncbi:Regulation of longevity by E3 ubiquitin-protein ligase [Armadillidium nasatum]|uniref:Regulation of longevity by E3 ubiquitin-protein ligase n=1 Tax=Armadillidium nasatum TaxID=96803 RepID=A0A5N5T5N8_9CRUS|nr:Regulation of longevity by E3 ubiquitin-protein ligase [Armadillidium nasatum]
MFLFCSTKCVTTVSLEFSLKLNKQNPQTLGRMDEIISCEVCNLEFNHFEIIPKVLLCGHSFCTVCIQKSIVINKVCPKCRVAITVTESPFPTNYSILRSVDIRNSTKSDAGIVAALKVMKRKCQDRLNELSEKKSKITKSLDVTKECLTKLEKLPKSEIINIGAENAEQVVRDIKTCLTSTSDVKVPDVWKIHVSAPIRFSDFGTPIKFLQEVNFGRTATARLKVDSRLYL